MERFRWQIRGQVQGVGFRPFVYRLATELGLTGLVRNDAAGVTLELQGPPATLATFRRRFPAELPPLSRIDDLQETALDPIAGEARFAIAPSATALNATAAVTIDTAVCPDCLRELFDPQDRRYRYGLINCTNCGPRLSIIRQVPYDRPHTTMAAFPLCPQCRAEYENPADRRFHAQPTCCPVCGPRVVLRRVGASDAIPGDVYAHAAALLAAGKILAIKGLGGFHIACRADDPAAVGRLRQLKRRDAKPFALMCRDRAAAERLVQLSAGDAVELTSPRAPIILALRQPDTPVAPQVAPQNHRLGVMLPYTPIHHLLFAALDAAIPALVMTSGNLSDEPLAIADDEAVARLGGPEPIVDAFLLHERPIQRPVEDSILLATPSGPLPIRRSRGYAPVPLPASTRLRRALCLGAELKSTLAVVRPGEVIMSAHLGDLTNALTYEHFRRAATDMLRLFSLQPELIVHDLHPMYLSTQYARQLAAEFRVPLHAVQHHHAHAAAVLAEHGITESALAIVCDGTGYGSDGTIWGGEILLVHPNGTFQRRAHLKPIRLAGGDAAAKDTRRPALALLQLAFGDAFVAHPLAARLFPDADELRTLSTMLRKGIQSPLTSSTGRVFDGIASLLNVCQRNDFEAQAGIALEALAWAQDVPGCHPLFVLEQTPGGSIEINLAPLIQHLITTTAPIETRAALFHRQLAAAFASAAAALLPMTPSRAIGLSGGVLCNQVFAENLAAELRTRGCTPLTHRLVPPNDGGIAYGQACLAGRREEIRNSE